MRTVSVTEFRRNLPAYLKRISVGEEIGVTSHGKVIARLLPEKDPAEEARHWLEALRGKVVLGDVTGSTEEMSWSADEDHL